MTKEEMARLLCLANVNISHEELNCAWEAAQALDPEGKCRVSYQTFREALCQVINCKLHVSSLLNLLLQFIGIILKSIMLLYDIRLQVREEMAKIQNIHIDYQTEPCRVGPEPKPRRKPNPCWGVDP
jgi:hypothetical protein